MMAVAPIVLDDLITEKDFQQTVIELAQICGYLVYHTHDSRRSAAGFPDLVLVGKGRVIFAELKTERGRLRRDQVKWLQSLGACRGVECYEWRPHDWNQIVRILRAV